MADADDIREAAAANAVDSVESMTTDGQSATARDPLKQLQVADKLAANSAAAQPHFGLRMTQLRPGGCG